MYPYECPQTGNSLRRGIQHAARARGFCASKQRKTNDGDVPHPSRSFRPQRMSAPRYSGVNPPIALGMAIGSYSHQDFAPTRTTTPPSGVSVRIDSGRARFNCGATYFWQATEKTNIFECVSIWVKGGWKETRGVRRPISGEQPVSESRMASLNPFETKRKKAQAGASSRVCDWFVAEGSRPGSNLLQEFLGTSGGTCASPSIPWLLGNALIFRPWHPESF